MNRTSHLNRKVRQFQNNLYKEAKKNKERKFHALYDRISEPFILKKAWILVKANKGKPGVDGVSISDIEAYGVDKYLSEISKHLREKTYKSKVIKRVMIPKVGGGERALGIPCIWDRIVQTACKLVLEPIFESNFKENSYGYRPKRCQHDAVVYLRAKLVSGWYVLDADIKGFFDNLDHRILLNLLKRRIADGSVLKLISGWLKCTVYDDKTKTLTKCNKGTPQGGVISPLLSNIYLHTLDAFWELTGIQGELIRFADDFVVVCRERHQAIDAKFRISSFLKRLGLELHPEKTKIMEMRPGNSFDFLGFRFVKWINTKSGKLGPYVFPARKVLHRFKTKVGFLLSISNFRVPLEILVRRVNLLVRGFWNYFQIGNCSKHFRRLDNHIWRKFRNHFIRRFQKMKKRRKRFHEFWETSKVERLGW